MSSSSPLVSIIVPTCNRPDFLPAALDSVRVQTCADWELILADDGSGAPTQELLRSFRDPRARVLWLAHTGSPAVVRNRALEEARGEYIAFLDSDDVWMPEKLELQLASLSQRPARGWSYTDFVLVDETGCPLTGARARHAPALDGWILKELVCEQAAVTLPSVMVRRRLLERVGGYDENLLVCEDLDLWVRLAQHSEVDFIDRPLVHVRRHGQHYSDDLTALEGLDSALAKMHRCLPADVQPLVRSRRARVAVGLMRGYASSGRTRPALATIASSVAYSWRSRFWWQGAGTAAILALAPRGVVDFLRAGKRAVRGRLAVPRSARAPGILRSVWSLLDGRQRRRLVALQLLSVVMALSTVSGMAAVLPFFTVLADPGAIQRRAGLRFLYEHIHFSSEHRFVLALGVGFALLVVVTNVVNLLGTLAMHGFAYQVGDELQTALFEDYLHRGYAFHVQSRSATLTSRVIFETARVTAGVLQQGLVLVTCAVSITFIVGSMLLLDPLVALLAILGLGAGYAAAYALARSRLLRNGRAEREAYEERTRIVSESLAGIRDVILLKAQGAFVDRFERCCDTISRTYLSNQAISQAPRYLLEGATACVLAGVALYLSGSPRTAHPWVAQLGFMGFAVYRLLPALQQLFAAIVRMRADRETFESLAADLRCARARSALIPATGSPWPRRPRGEILLREVWFRHAGGSAPAVAGLDLRIPAGAVVGLIGANGSGKTTVLDLICGLLAPQSGTILADGIKLDEHNRAAWQSCIAYVPQQIFLLDGTVAENVAFGVPREHIDRERVRAAAQAVQLTECIAALPGGYCERLGERGAKLSGGQRQRLGIARALYRRAPIIILDEATSALDVAGEREIVDALIRHRHGATVVVVAHRPGGLRHCDVIHELCGGKIVRQMTYGQLVKEVAQGDARLPQSGELAAR